MTDRRKRLERAVGKAEVIPYSEDVWPISADAALKILDRELVWEEKDQAFDVGKAAIREARQILRELRKAVAK